MDNTKTNVPEIRFPGYTDPWEQRKLSDVADIIGGGTPSTDVPEYWDGDIDWYAPAEINDQIYVDHSERKITQLGLDKSSAKILPANKTVLFTSRAGIGKTAILQHDAATNQGFQSLVLNDDTNPYFIFTMTEMIKVNAEKVASGSTFAEISGKMLGKLEFMFPTYEEQVRIGDCFKHIDDTITLHQRKCDELKLYKKGLLQQMFPQPGVAFPRVRFPGFTDPWEQRKFGELCSIVTKQTGFDYTATIKKSLVTEASEDTLPYLQTKNFAGVSISYDTDYFIPRSVAKEFPKINLDEKCILFSIVGASVGNIGLFPGDKHCFLSGAICVSKLNNHDDADYLYHYMCSENGQSQIRTCTKGGAQATITIEDIREFDVLLPSEQERAKIGELLSSLDNLITLHQRKCDELKLYKKGLLQKMFV